MGTRKLAVLCLLAIGGMGTAIAQDDAEVESAGDRLATAIESGSVAAVRRVLESGVSPNTLAYDTPALIWATWDERFYVVKLLVERGADVNLSDDQGYTPLMAAAAVPSEKIARLLLDAGADTDAVESTYGMSALQSACEAGDERVVDLLIERGADAKHVDKYGGNCLEEAAFYGYQPIVDKLRERGLTTQWPLHVACGLGDREEVKNLLATGAQADEANEGWQNTPLHFAAGGGHVEVAKLLVKQGAKLDAQNVLGAQPLHVAAGADKLALAKWLVAQGVDMNAADHDGNTPLDWSSGDVYEFLQERGAEYGEREEP